MAKQYGYARVSTAEQSLEVQLQALTQVGVNKIYKDKATGKNGNRVGLQALLTILETGDTLVVTKLDRIARNIKEGIALLEELTERGIKLHVLNMGLFDGTATSKLLRNILLSVAEWEKEILERQREGIALARAQGKYKGKPKKYTEKNKSMNQALDWLANRAENGKTVKEICEITKVSRASLYSIARERGIEYN
ncbi:recombinase family protein [Bacillus sp. S2(2019)]|uniref:recombinase family protein n=1 Tax=unclassified Bacillus (in: firmicutes) TaxID=185979 RepID=UPI0006941AC8|nr:MULTISPECIES: recombinase family protein [unclassified Bacillus (in: firmicutes)]KOA73612.1 integrase [Bacillus stratosphericus]TKD56796.1 recombinase family protein [Bacillus sp. S2(2019)]